MTAGGGSRIAFVAGGGAVKGYAFHVGVLRGLEEDGFRFRGGLRWDAPAAPAGARVVDIYVGSSAGACIAASLACGYSVDVLRGALAGTAGVVPKFGYGTMFVPIAPDPLKYARGLVRRWRAGAIRPHHLLDPGGLFSSVGIERYFRRHALPTNRFADLAAELYLTATQVNGSRKVVFGPRDSLGEDGTYSPVCAYYDNVEISHALAASVAVPPVFAPYAIVNPASGERVDYYDGEVREPLSTHVAVDAGADFVIASSIWNAYRFDERIGSLADYGMSVLAEQAVHQTIEQKIGRARRLRARLDRLLELIGERDAARGVPPEETAAFREEVCRLLQHRPTRTLYVEPDPSDAGFFFGGFFRFSDGLIDRCVAAGHTAYRRAVRDDPGFLEALDEALAQG